MNKKKTMLLILLVVIVTMFIFSNSFMNSKESNATSGVIVELVRPLVEFIAGSDADVNFIVRKGAHLTEFFALGFLVLLAVFEIKKEFLGFGFFYVLFVGVTDEFIQSFSDRTSSVSDVLIDFSGAMLGFAACGILSLCIRKFKQMLIVKKNKR